MHNTFMGLRAFSISFAINRKDDWPWWKNQRRVHWSKSPCWLSAGPWLLIIFMKAKLVMVLSPSSGRGSPGFRFSESLFGCSPTSTLFSKLWGSLKAGHLSLRKGPLWTRNVNDLGVLCGNHRLLMEGYAITDSLYISGASWNILQDLHLQLADGLTLV